MPELKKIAILLLFAVLFAAGCSSPQPSANADPANIRVMRDGMDTSVVMPLHPRRVISLAPNITEMIFAAGGGDRLVGVTTYCNFPDAARDIKRVGDTLSPNVETVIALQPEVVFVSRDSQLESFRQILLDRKISVFVVDIASFDDITSGLRRFGEIFGTESIEAAAAVDIERRVAAVKAERPPHQPRIFVQISQEPLFTVGAGSLPVELVRTAGGEVVTATIATAYPKLSKETALALEPEIIILSDSEDNRRPNEVFARTSAVVNGQVYRIDPDLLSRPGPRSVDALEQIADILAKASTNP